MEFITLDQKVISVNKEAEAHLEAHPDVWGLLPEAVSKINISETKTRADGVLEIEIDMGRIVGVSGLVEAPLVEIGGITLFSYRKNHSHPSRIVRQDGQPCDTITISAILNNDSDEWNLLTAYIGYICPEEPFYVGDQESEKFKVSLKFWSTHALAYDQEIMAEPFESTWEKELTKLS